mgnify:CR=1 FL=1
MITKIVADYDTCRKAHDIGLRIESVFSWILFQSDPPHVFEQGIILSKNGGHYPALTAEEVPFPDTNSFAYYLKTDISSGFKYTSLCEYHREHDEEMYVIEIENENMNFKINEATARLKMAIWLIKNVPEARQWYIDNGYLGEIDNG